MKSINLCTQFNEKQMKRLILLILLFNVFHLNKFQRRNVIIFWFLVSLAPNNKILNLFDLKSETIYRINHPADLPRMQCCTCVGKLMYLSASYWHQLLRTLDSEAKEYLYMGAPWRGCLNRTHHRPDTVSARIRFMNTRNWESLKRSPLPSTSVAPYERVITRSWRTPHVRYDTCTRAKT